MGLSSHPAAGYDTRTQAADIRPVLSHLGLQRAVIVGYGIVTVTVSAEKQGS
jgi:hypothetical protein